MSVGFYLNITFGLKPEVSGIKIVSDCLQTIHFPSWVAHSHFDLIRNLYILLIKLFKNKSEEFAWNYIPVNLHCQLTPNGSYGIKWQMWWEYLMSL